jgi:hypothetical protein
MLSQKLVGGQGFEPGPRGPEIHAVSSTEAVFAAFEFISRTRRPNSGEIHPPMSTELVNEVDFPLNRK